MMLGGGQSTVVKGERIRVALRQKERKNGGPGGTGGVADRYTNEGGCSRSRTHQGRKNGRKFSGENYKTARGRDKGVATKLLNQYEGGQGIVANRRNGNLSPRNSKRGALLGKTRVPQALLVVGRGMREANGSQGRSL